MTFEWANTEIGLLHRTGPAEAELIDQETGDVYQFNIAELENDWSEEHSRDPIAVTDELFRRG
jgi:hypothetical protein